MTRPGQMASSNSNMTLLPGVFIVFLTIIFGGNTVAIKLALAGMGPMTTAGLRFALASVAIACWAFATGRSFRILPGQAPQLMIVAIAFTLQLSLFYLGLDRTYASRGVLLSNLLPFFVLFLSHRFIPGERITWGKMAGIVLGFCGVAFMFTGTQGVSGSLHDGDLIILAAVFVWSGNVVYTKRIINDYSPFHLASPFPTPAMSRKMVRQDWGKWNLDWCVCIPEPGQRRLRVCGLEHHAQTIRGVNPACLCVHHAHRRRGRQRFCAG